MLYFSASVLKTPPSTSRISRRMTLSRVVVLPVKVMRLTKYLLAFRQPHRHVHRRLGRPGDRALGRVLELHVGKAGELEVAAAAVELARFLEALADVLLRIESPGFSLKSGCRNSVLMTLLPSNVTSPTR